MTSTVKVNNVQASDGGNIINQCGTNITIGASGDTIALATGASQTGFGRTGTVDWETTPKTGDFTGVNGKGYFINTTSGKITMTLPSASAGDIISIQDYNNTFDSYSFVIQAPSGVKINGGTAAGEISLSTEGQGLTLVYVDSTVGWRSIESTTFSSSSVTPTYITASGGNTTLTVGDYKTHIFTGPGTFTVCSVGNCTGSNTIEYVVVAGGGGGSFGGGGAGGFRQNYPSPATGGLPVTATGYPVAVGGAGTGRPCSTSGSNSVFTGSTTITSAGGGRGGGANSNVGTGAAGGSGGGGGHNPDAGGAGNTPPVSPVAQGFAGGTGHAAPYYGGGGGGGATAIGTNATPGSPSENTGGNGGAGNYWPDAVLGPTAPSYGTPGPVGSTRYFAGGGGGSYMYSTCKGIGGAGGGGNAEQPSPAVSATTGTTNTGGGGGGGNGSGKNGGSGIVMIRYKFQ